jgi:hypothetical protein
MDFDLHSRRFEFEFEPDPNIQAPTEIFVPNYQYPRGIRVNAPAGTWTHDPAAQILRYNPASPSSRHKIILRPA